jgi:hypothetical protein
MNRRHRARVNVLVIDRPRRGPPLTKRELGDLARDLTALADSIAEIARQLIAEAVA